MDCKRVTVIRVGPVFSTGRKSTARKRVVLFFLYRRRKKAGASHKRESHRLC